MAKTFQQMNKTELLKAITSLKLEDKVVAKDPKNPTNAEYVTTLNEFKKSQANMNPDEAREQEIDDKIEAAKPVKKVVSESDAPALTKQVQKQMQVDHLNNKVPVIITDHDITQVVDEDTEARTVPVSWGNPIIGMTTTNIALHGKMQYVTRGAIKALKSIPIATHKKNAAGTEVSDLTRKRFSIAEVEGWTKEEFEAHKKEQQLKKIK